MNLAVRLYSSITIKPQGIPDEWPAEVVELYDATELPPNLNASDGWILMTTQDLVDRKATYQSLYDAFILKQKMDLDKLAKELAIKTKIQDTGGAHWISKMTDKDIRSLSTSYQPVSFSLDDDTLSFGNNAINKKTSSKFNVYIDCIVKISYTLVPTGNSVFEAVLVINDQEAPTSYGKGASTTLTRSTLVKLDKYDNIELQARSSNAEFLIQPSNIVLELIKIL